MDESDALATAAAEVWPAATELLGEGNWSRSPRRSSWGCARSKPPRRPRGKPPPARTTGPTRTPRARPRRPPRRRGGRSRCCSAPTRRSATGWPRSTARW
ncbi:hypothetical protein ACFQ60_08370 [Streptomyces zhihengii]